MNVAFVLIEECFLNRVEINDLDEQNESSFAAFQGPTRRQAIVHGTALLSSAAIASFET